MQEVTITLDNFNYIEFMNAYYLHGGNCYITKAKDRDDNAGVLLFIPTTNINEIIKNLCD